MAYKAGAAPLVELRGGVQASCACHQSSAQAAASREKPNGRGSGDLPCAHLMISRSSHFTMPTSARTGGRYSLPPACRTMASPRGECPKRTARDGYSRCPKRERLNEEANPVEGDPADPRRRGTVPGRRWDDCEQRPIQPGEVSFVWTPELQVRLASVRGRRAKAVHVHCLRTHSRASASMVSAVWLAA